MKKIKLNPIYENNEIILKINGYEIRYILQPKDDYIQGGCGAATMREYLEYVENEEASTHYMYLKDTEWNIVIHGYVLHDFYLNNFHDEVCGELELHSKFTGLGTSQYLEGERTEIETIGIITKEDNDLFFTTVGGNTIVKMKLTIK